MTIVIQEIQMCLQYDVQMDAYMHTYIHTYIHSDTAPVQHVNVGRLTTKTDQLQSANWTS